MNSSPLAFKWLKPSEVFGNDLPETVLLETVLPETVLPETYTDR